MFFRKTACFLGAMLLICFSGCTHLGDRLQHEALPPGAPSVQDILDSLAANEAALQGFRATGTVIFQSPELESTQVSRESSIRFRYPLDLHVVGRKYGTRFVELTCSGPAFLIAFPTEKQFYFQPKGERLNTVSTSEMAREIFQPESWKGLSPKQIRVVSYDGAAQTAVLEIYEKPKNKQPRRRLVVQGTPWVVLENWLFDEEGRELAVTKKEDYYVMDGVRFPRKVDSEFPGEEALMRLNLKNITINPEPDPMDFDLKKQKEDYRKRGFEQVESLRGVPGGGGENALDQGDGGYVENFKDDQGSDTPEGVEK